MGDIILNSKDQQRLKVLNLVMARQLTVQQAAELLGVSERQMWRIVATYKKEGAAALPHGNRGRTPQHALEEQLRNKVVELARNKYQGCNHQHLSELLAEHEGISISRSSVRNILLEAGIKSPRKRRAPRHRSRRARYPQEGMLLQMDASPHDWLQGRGSRLVLVGCIDDATGTVPGAEFRYQEDAHGYMLVLRQVVLTHGRPVAVYHDRHSVFEQTPRRMVDWSIEEQLRGEREPTQFGRVLQELEINPITAHSPQAKGRVERLFGTLQDRLVVELALAGASTLEEANLVLWEYLPRFNKRFGVPAAQEGLAYRPTPEGCDPDTIFCFKYSRTVGADNIVRLGEHRLQLLASDHRCSYAKAKVQVHERLDGSLAVYYQGECLAHQSAPPEAPILRARGGKRGTVGLPTVPATSTPAQNHPWRKPFLFKD